MFKRKLNKNPKTNLGKMYISKKNWRGKSVAFLPQTNGANSKSETLHKFYVCLHCLGKGASGFRVLVLIFGLGLQESLVTSLNIFQFSASLTNKRVSVTISKMGFILFSYFNN